MAAIGAAVVSVSLVAAMTAAGVPVGLCGRESQANHQAERCDAKEDASDVLDFAHATPLDVMHPCLSGSIYRG